MNIEEKGTFSLNLTDNEIFYLTEAHKVLERIDRFLIDNHLNELKCIDSIMDLTYSEVDVSIAQDVLDVLSRFMIEMS